MEGCSRGGVMGAFNLICLVAELSFQITCFQKESGNAAEISSKPLLTQLALTTLIVPRVDSSIHSFRSTRRTLALIKACRGVILNAGLLFNPRHIDYSCQQSPNTCWALIFKVNAQMPRKVFFFLLLLFIYFRPLPTYHSATLLSRPGSPCQEQHA